MNRLKELLIFQNVHQNTLDLLWNSGKVKRFPKNEILFRANEHIEYFYILLSGKAYIYNLTHHGNRKILFVHGPGSLLNEDILLDQTSSFYCNTLESSEIFMISSYRFQEIMMQDFSVMETVFQVQKRKLWRLGHQLKNTTSSIYMERKLASKLWKLGRDFGIHKDDGILIDMVLSVTFLSDMLGAPRETTSKCIKSLMQYGLIDMEKKTVILKDPDRLSVFYRTGEY